MPRPKKKDPSYRFHVSGQARVTLDGRDYLLGPHGSPESYARYYALLAQYHAGGLSMPERPETPVLMLDDKITVRQVTADFRARELPRHENNEGDCYRFKNLLALLEEKHGDEPVADFGPRKLASLRDGFVAAGNSRRYANTKTDYIIRIIEHGVSRELVEPDRIVALRSLRSLRQGEAKDNPPREPVAVQNVVDTLPELLPVVRAMVHLQVATAMRPSELFAMTPAMIDQSGETWFYRPKNHKNAHHNKKRAIALNHDAVAALTPYLFVDADALCFVNSAGKPWDRKQYRRAIERAAKRAGVDHWSPYQIRHLTLQTIRDASGPEAAQAAGGHSRLSTTEVYAKANEAKAAEAVKSAPRLIVG